MGSDPRTLKIDAARAALASVSSGMRLGLGTGSTAEEFVRLLGAQIAGGALGEVRCVCTSARTEELARSLSIPVASLSELAPLDVTVDGADEIDPRLRLIKGRGGAMLREKIVEQASRRFIVIADEGKLVERLGVGPLPVEVIPLAVDVLRLRFENAGFAPELRKSGGNPFMTDEGNRILDIRVPRDRDIADVIEEVRSNAGVVETGFFPDEASEAIIAGAAGVRVLRR
ncbi:MAG TPA: ribose-5-phosphate isomerase RpiA [Thermoanaerobaculia bacterium]|nr:ribose-5-phosphate isomerase RpiA [Thermoanaerobaculia bacterium]